MDKPKKDHRTKNFKTIPPCGTKSGYDYHRRGAIEEPCEPCRDAMKAYWVEMRRRRGKEIHERRKEREANNPHMIEARSRRIRRRRAQKMGVAHDGYTKFDVLERYGSDCYICGLPIDLDAPRRTGDLGWERGLQLDHVYPMIRGGADTIDNVRPTHGLCNNRKHATILDFSEGIK
jgi:hypothetical protein